MHCSVFIIGFLVVYSKAQSELKSNRSLYLDRIAASTSLSLPQIAAPFNVTIDHYIRSIPRFDEKKQEFDIDWSFRHNWVDQRLKFDFGNNDDYIVIPRPYYTKVWIPDTFIGNMVAERSKPDERSTLLRVYKNGTVYYSYRQIITVFCRMNFERLPFDKQTCNLHVASYGFTTKDAVYRWKENVSAPNDLTDNVHLFEIRDILHSSQDQTTSLGDTYSRLTMTIIFKRQFSFYFHHIFTPFVVLVNISWFTFFLHPSNVAARIIFLILLLATANILAAIVGSSIPHTTYRKALDTWISGCTIFIFLAIIETVLAIHFHHAKKMQEEEEDRKSDVEERLLPGKKGSGGRIQENEEKKGCMVKCSDWFTQRADKIDPVGKHIILGLFHVFIFYYVIRWGFF